jgi:hypothetical protein
MSYIVVNTIVCSQMVETDYHKVQRSKSYNMTDREPALLTMTRKSSVQTATIESEE